MHVVTFHTEPGRTHREVCTIEGPRVTGTLYARTPEHLRSSVLRVLHIGGVRLHEVEERRV